MIERIVSGGQTGVDQAALLAAYTLGIKTGGYACQGWETEDGPNPSLADYGLVEWSEPGYRLRTKANVVNSDGTLLIGNMKSPGSAFTIELCGYDQIKKPLFCITVHMMRQIEEDAAYRRYIRDWVLRWLKQWNIKTLNVAGNRESVTPGVGDFTYGFITDILT